MGKVIKSDIVDQVHRQTEVYPKETVKKIVEETIKAISTSIIAGDSVKIRNFGSFNIKRTPNRVGWDFINSKEIIIPARNTVKFVPSKRLRDGMNP